MNPISYLFPRPTNHLEHCAEVHQEEKKGLPPPIPKVGVEEKANSGLHKFFGLPIQKVNGQTHVKRILSAARNNDVEAFKGMLAPETRRNRAEENALGDSLRKLTTTTGGIIGVRHDEKQGTTYSAEARESYFCHATLHTMYLDHELIRPEDKRQYIQALAFKVYTSPIVETADGRKITFGQLGHPSTWEHIKPADLANSDIVPKLTSILKDCETIYKVSSSFTVNKEFHKFGELKKKTAAEMGLRKLWQETKKKNFSAEFSRQSGKFRAKTASLWRSRPGDWVDLDSVFAFKIRDLKSSVREDAEKMLIRNQVDTMMNAHYIGFGGEKEPEDICREIKQKKNYQMLRYPDKDNFLAEYIDFYIADYGAPDLAASPTEVESSVEFDNKSVTTLTPSLTPSELKYNDHNADLAVALRDWRLYQYGLNLE